MTLFILKLLAVPFLIYFPKTVFFSAIIKTTLIDSLNQNRKSAGIRPLKENAILDKAAVLKAQDILDKDYFGHQSPDGVSPWYWFQKAGYNYKFAGENLAIGFLDSDEVNQAWLDSPLHRANLLNSNYRDVGIAILTGDFQGNKTTVVVQLFGALQQTVSEPKVQTKEQAKKETSVSEAEKSEKEAAGTTTFFAELNSIKKEAAPVIKEAQEKAAFNFFSFLSSDYYKIFQIVIYGFLALIILSLLVNIFVRLDIQHLDLILKALGFIAVLVLFVLIDKGVIIKLIPHHFSIF